MHPSTEQLTRETFSTAETNAMLSENFTLLSVDRPTETPVSGRGTNIKNNAVESGLKLPDSLSYTPLQLLSK